jgi:ribonuclease Z
MKLTLLGTGTPRPDPARAGPSQLIQVGDDRLLVDCGSGAVRRLVLQRRALRQATMERSA